MGDGLMEGTVDLKIEIHKRTLVQTIKGTLAQVAGRTLITGTKGALLLEIRDALAQVAKEILIEGSRQNHPSKNELQKILRWERGEMK